MKLNKVYDNLFIRGHFHKWPYEKKLNALRQEHRINVVVCMIPPYDADMTTIVDYYLHSPMSDGPNFDASQVEAVADSIAIELALGNRVVVHCRAGQNRSAFIAARAIMRFTGMFGEEAVRLVREGRPNALTNPHFVRYLTHYAR